jgi:hypothetical protein
MLNIVGFIDRIAPGLYLLVAALCLWMLWRWLNARRKYRATYFELERDLARLQQANAVTTAILALQFAVAVWGVQWQVLPFLQRESDILSTLLETQLEDGAFVTATPAAAAEGGLNIEPVEIASGQQNQIQLTPTLTPTPVGTLIPNPPATQGCNDPRATLQVPANGMRVFQPITVIGTAYTDNFTTAKIEINGPGTNNTYAVVGEAFQPVYQTAEFSQFAPAGYEAGVYQFRLMVFDLSGAPVASCMVNVYITEPPVTATPTLQPGANATPRGS